MTHSSEHTSKPATGRLAAWRPWLIGAVGAIVLAVIIGISTVFKDCIHTEKNDHRYNALRESPRTLLRPITRLHLHAVCVESWADKNQGAIAAVATVFIAIFTLTLWDATKRLWRSAESELTEFRRSLDIANKHAAHMAKSVAESARAATAMENVAIAMNASAQAAEDNVKTVAEANAATADANRINHEHFIAEQRPWIFPVEAEIYQLDIQDDQVSATLIIKLANSGKIPARGILIDAAMYADRLKNRALIYGLWDRWLVKSYSVRRYRMLHAQNYMLPGQIISYEYPTNVSPTNDEQTVPTMSDVKLWVYGSVIYQFDGSSNSHQTTFIYQLGTANTDKSKISGIDMTTPGIITGSKLRMLPEFMANRAN